MQIESAMPDAGRLQLLPLWLLLLLLLAAAESSTDKFSQGWASSCLVAHKTHIFSPGWASPCLEEAKLGIALSGVIAAGNNL